MHKHNYVHTYVLRLMSNFLNSAKLLKARPFLLSWKIVLIYKTTYLFEVHALCRVGELGPLREKTLLTSKRLTGIWQTRMEEIS